MPKEDRSEAVFDRGFHELDSNGPVRINLLDVGPEEYGDALLCEFGNVTVLIDGAHPGNHRASGDHRSIPDQIGRLLNRQPPFHFSLLIISHAHLDHIGCLPRLVQDHIVEFDWALVTDPQLGWGRGTGEDRDSLIPNDDVRRLAASMHEEIRTDRTNDEQLAEFLTDAMTLEPTYIRMLETLDARGTRVIRHGRNSTQALVQAFNNVGLRIVGPTRNHLLECADLINGSANDSIARATDMFRTDAALDPVRAYRQITAGGVDALDASRAGPAVNLQSSVVIFNVQGHKFLFGGDMQFEDPQVSNNFVLQSVKRLRQKIKAEAPFSFVKLCHHGSFNAFSEEILGELGNTRVFGICAGEGSKHHPNRGVLQVLDEHRQQIRWARTDHNGQVTFTFTDGPTDIRLTKGSINDPHPNTEDVLIPARPTEEGAAPETPEPPAPKPAIVPGPAESATSVTTTLNQVEIHAKFPHVSTRVTITVEVEPRGSAAQPASTPHEDRPLPRLDIAAGRSLPELLFVTSKQALAENIGIAETNHLLASMRARNLALYDELPRGTADPASMAGIVRGQLSQKPGVRGIVIIGGYDVVPAQILDCLPRSLRQGLPSNDDPDQFTVWSDDIYGLPDGAGMPRLPVSRVPDGKSAQLVFAAIQAKNAPLSNPRTGVRNVARPFAQPIYQSLPGSANMLVSQPSVFSQNPAINLQADRVYFMLHGDYVDSTRFWGEGTADNREAVNISNVPPQSGRVVFAGCCWGALIAGTPAGLVEPNRPFGQKSADSSIALSFLSKGSNAFVGCTGAHYSPTEPPFQYFGGPMHQAFWRAFNAGTPAAEALLRAKREYSSGMPHGQTSTLSRAIEYKILRQYTCLGLGW